MTKDELRNSLIANGWEVAALDQWRLVEQLGERSMYDVPAVSPEDRFGTSQVVVIDDGGAGETATARGFIAGADETFDQAVRDYVRGIEESVGAIFAIEITRTNEPDEVALATAYNSDGSQANYVVKRRNATFGQVQLT